MNDKEKDDFSKSLEVMAIHEKTVTQILILAAEYEDKTITAERFADRVLVILKANYKRYTEGA